MCEATFPVEKIKYATTTFDLTLGVELRFQIPATDFDENMIRHQIKRDIYGIIRGVRVDKDALARSLGMESTQFLSVSTRPNIDLDKIEMTKFDEKGMVIARYEEPR